MKIKYMNKNPRFQPCIDFFGKDASIVSASYQTVDEAKKAILKELVEN